MVSQKDSRTTTSFMVKGIELRVSLLYGGVCQSGTAALISILCEPPVKANHERSRNNCRVVLVFSCWVTLKPRTRIKSCTAVSRAFYFSFKHH
jgi:hypothetical protein